MSPGCLSLRIPAGTEAPGAPEGGGRGRDRDLGGRRPRLRGTGEAPRTVSLSLAARSSARGSAARRTPVGGSRVPPSRPPQVSKRSPASPPESPVALPTRSRTARTSRPCPSLCLVSPRTTLSTPRLLCMTSGPGEILKNKNKNKSRHSQLHYILHHSRHLPSSSPSGREAPGARNAQAPSLLRTLGPRPSAQAQPEVRARTGPRERALGNERQGAQENPVRRRDGRSTRTLLLSRGTLLVEPQKGGLARLESESQRSTHPREWKVNTQNRLLFGLTLFFFFFFF